MTGAAIASLEGVMLLLRRQRRLEALVAGGAGFGLVLQEETFRIGRVRIVTGGAVRALDMEMRRSARWRLCGHVLVAIRAELGEVLLQQQLLGEAMALVAGLAVLLRHRGVHEFFPFVLLLGILVTVVAGPALARLLRLL